MIISPSENAFDVLKHLYFEQFVLSATFKQNPREQKKKNIINLIQKALMDERLLSNI